MIRYDMPQGDPEWFAARLGLPTSSQFHRLLSAKTLKPSTGAKGYLHELLAELYLGENQDPSGGSEYMVRGTSLEPEAVRYYEMQRDTECEVVGFCTTDDGMVGCSPDRLVGEDGLLEVKCPAGKVHIGYLLGEDAHKHRAQVQGQMWVTGRAYCDLLIYSPFLPPSLTRHEVDEEWVEAFEPALATFLAQLADARTRLDMMGLEVIQ